MFENLSFSNSPKSHPPTDNPNRNMYRCGDGNHTLHTNISVNVTFSVLLEEHNHVANWNTMSAKPHYFCKRKDFHFSLYSSSPPLFFKPKKECHQYTMEQDLTEIHLDREIMMCQWNPFLV